MALKKVAFIRFFSSNDVPIKKCRVIKVAVREVHMNNSDRIGTDWNIFEYCLSMSTYDKIKLSCELDFF